MQYEESRNYRAVTWEIPAEDEPREIGADQWDRQDDRERDADTRPGHKVVGEGVTEEAVHDRKRQERYADDPVELAWPAERAGEEHAAHVHCDRADEDVGGPVVHLADDETAPHRERQVHGRGVRSGHRLSPERLVRALVDDVGGRRLEVERQEDRR